MVANFFSVVQDFTLPLRALFYLVTPAESSPKQIEDAEIPLPRVVPFLIVLIALEFFYSLLKKRNVYQLNDSIACLLVRIFSFIPFISAVALGVSSYDWVHRNYRIVNLPSDSLVTWIVAIVAVDFTFYWWHRASHEINILWAFHQTHHSSECLNFITALRFPIHVELTAMFFKLPMALFLPTEMYVMHLDLNGLYQIWIHSELVCPLGPIEWIFNTPTHHKVHHGRNPYCIDKNYAGFLIIWDRIFGIFRPQNNSSRNSFVFIGTFQEVRKDETIHYGLVHNIRTFDFLYIEFGAFIEIWQKLKPNSFISEHSFPQKMTNIFKGLFYGPGWNAEKPQLRLGDPQDVPPIEPRPERYNPKIPLWHNLYCIVHFAVIAAITAISAPMYFEYHEIFIYASYYAATACSIGYILDGKWFAGYVETIRCLSMALWYVPLPIKRNRFYSSLFFNFHIISFVSWILCSTLFKKARYANKQ